MGEIFNLILPYLLSAIGVLISGLATWLTTIVVKWFNSKIANKEIAELLETITIVVSESVKATYQTYVESIKHTNAWTKEAQEKALQEALATAKKSLTTDALNLIKERHGDIDEYLKTLIHSVLYDLKN